MLKKLLKNFLEWNYKRKTLRKIKSAMYSKK